MFHYVAPYTGAWIETAGSFCKCWKMNVAPYTGAWIETQNLVECSVRMGVAPYTGAWIETFTMSVVYKDLWSHLTQVRGLKREYQTYYYQAMSRTLHRCVD